MHGERNDAKLGIADLVEDAARGDLELALFDLRTATRDEFCALVERRTLGSNQLATQKSRLVEQIDPLFAQANP